MWRVNQYRGLLAILRHKSLKYIEYVKTYVKRKVFLGQLLRPLVFFAPAPGRLLHVPDQPHQTREAYVQRVFRR